MGRQYDIEDTGSSTSADSSTLVDPSLSDYSIFPRCRSLFSWFASRRAKYSDHRRQGDSQSHDGAHRRHAARGRSSCCGSTSLNSDESLPMPLFVRTDSENSEKKEVRYQNVKLSVSGMTCSGCERSLHRALERIPTVKDIHTDMATSQALFAIDVNTISVDQAIQHLERTTPYELKQVDEANEGSQFLYVLLKRPDRPFRGSFPRGVKGVKKTGRENNGRAEVRIEYDPRSILPRDLMEKELGDPLAELAPIPPPDSVSAGRKHLRRELTYFVIALIFTVPVLILVWTPLSIPEFNKEIACLLLATAVQISAWEFYPNAFKSLFHSKMADMDLLVVLSTTAAYTFSVVAFALYGTGHPLAEGSFFETSTLLVTLIRLGRYMAELARQKATESVSVRTLQTSTARLLAKHRNETRDVDVRLLQPGDTIRVPPHTRIPTDGVVVYGGSQVDESMMTGESHPVAKGIDSEVTAGTMNLDGQLDVSVTRMIWENSISQIGALIDNAELTKPKIQALADRVAGYFVPGIITISTAVFLIWVLVGIFHYKRSGADAAVDAVSYAIATLIISCPCAIGLAVPMVIIIASGVAAKHGVIFRAPTAIETARSATHVVFDKTGTLTEGKLSVVAGQFFSKPKSSSLPYLLGLVAGQKHPVASAVADWILTQDGDGSGYLEPVKFTTSTTIVGSGIEGILVDPDSHSTTVVRAGHTDWLALPEPLVAAFRSRLSGSQHPASPTDRHGLDYTLFGLTMDGQPQAVFALRDALRPEAAFVVAALRERHGAAVSIVSGDSAQCVWGCADALNVRAATHALARCTPADKAAYVASVQAAEPGGTVVFVGDGTNDAAALKQAAVGVAVASAGGTDVAAGAADVVLARPDLRGLLVALELSAGAVRRVRFNFVWAAVYNSVAVLLAAGAFVWADGRGGGIKIPPEFAGLGEIASVLPVVLIAFSLRFTKFAGYGGQRAAAGME